MNKNEHLYLYLVIVDIEKSDGNSHLHKVDFEMVSTLIAPTSINEMQTKCVGLQN